MLIVHLAPTMAPFVPALISRCRIARRWLDAAAPGGIASADDAVSGFALHDGPLFAGLLFATQAAFAIGIWSTRTRRANAVLAIVVAALFGVVGQNLGGIFSNGWSGLLGSGATDLGSGPPLVLLALTLWLVVSPRRGAARTSLDQPIAAAVVVPSTVPA